MDVSMGLDWSTEQGIDPKMLNVNHMTSSMENHSSNSHSPQEESLGHIPPNEQYFSSPKLALKHLAGCLRRFRFGDADGLWHTDDGVE
jgi:hypothetical protein